MLFSFILHASCSIGSACDSFDRLSLARLLLEVCLMFAGNNINKKEPSFLNADTKQSNKKKIETFVDENVRVRRNGVWFCCLLFFWRDKQNVNQQKDRRRKGQRHWLTQDGEKAHSGDNNIFKHTKKKELKYLWRKVFAFFCADVEFIRCKLYGRESVTFKNAQNEF